MTTWHKWIEYYHNWQISLFVKLHHVLTVTNSIPGILASDEDDVDDSNFVSIM